MTYPLSTRAHPWSWFLLLATLSLLIAGSGCSPKRSSQGDDPTADAGHRNGAHDAFVSDVSGADVGDVSVEEVSDVVLTDTFADDAAQGDSSLDDLWAGVDVGAGPGTVVGPKGGVVTVPGVATLEIPAGALSKPVKITAEAAGVPKTAYGVAFTTQLVTFGPDGLSFARPCTLTLQYDETLVPNDGSTDEQKLWLYGDTGVTLAWKSDKPVAEQDLHEVVHTTVDKKSGTLSVPISHFSDYVGGVAANGLTFVTLQSGAEALRVLRRSVGLAANGAANRAVTSHVVVHHTDGGGNLRAQFRSGWFQANAGNNSAQLWVGRNGVIGQVSNLDKVIGHAPPTNSVAIGVELLNTSEQNYPLVQILGLRRLLSYLSARYNIPVRGRWDPAWPDIAAVRNVPPGFRHDQLPPTGSPDYEKILAHREVDRHRWVIRAAFPNGQTQTPGASHATHISYSADVSGTFRRPGNDNWDCGGGPGSTPWSFTASGAPWRRQLANQALVCFFPSAVTTLATTITITARTVRQGPGGAWLQVGAPNTIELELNLPAEHVSEVNDSGPAGSAGRPRLIGARRRHDPGNMHPSTNSFPWNQLYGLLSYKSNTGIIDATGGDSFYDGVAGQGGDIEFRAGYEFPANHFDAAENSYLSAASSGGDEASAAYITHVAAGTTKTLGAGQLDTLWLIVEGTLQLTQDTVIKAVQGIYVAPGGKIIAHDASGTTLNGYALTLDSAGDVLIFGQIDATGLDAPAVGTTAAPGGAGGKVIIRQLPSGHTLVPTLISMGGDVDVAKGGKSPKPDGGQGGNVTVTATGAGARLILGGGTGDGGVNPAWVQHRLPPAPLTTIWTPKTPKPKNGDRPVLSFAHFTRGILTGGGTGGTYSGNDRTKGGKGGQGGNIKIEAAQIRSQGAYLWTGSGVHQMNTRFYTKNVSGTLTSWENSTGGCGGSGNPGGLSFNGADGGDGGDAGDITIVGSWFPPLSPGGTTQLFGWNNQKAHLHPTSQLVGQGSVQAYAGTVPGAAAATPLLYITAQGGSGGFPGGSVKGFPGGFGLKGADGSIKGAP